MTAAESVRVVETHSAVVLLCGDRAYKWKKPVDFGFLDFRGREQRAVACQRELELNRRLAPDVYLGVGTLAAADGDPVEHVLMMRRLPDDRRLSLLVERGDDVEACLRVVARTIAALHARTVAPEAAGPASASALRGNWEDNLRVLRNAADHLVEEEVEQVAGLALAYLEGREPLFERRSALACDGHGDLLADDIFCMDDGPRIIDCLDFADHLRMGDPLLDAAFLAMDLERLGSPDLAERFLGWYGEFSGASAPESLRHHFVAYRAHVRAKVAVLRAGQGDEEAPQSARRLHALCREHLVAGQVALVVVGGLPGVGKSTVARAIADGMGWTVLSSDELRKDLLGLDRHSGAPGDAYSLEARTAVYRELLARARTLLAHGESVVLDASWLEENWRDAAERVAEETVVPRVLLRCEVPLEVARARLASRAAGGPHASDATSEVLDTLAGRDSPWSEAHPVDTSGSADAVGRRAIDLVRGALDHTDGADDCPPVG